jgi:hypothetical protein
VKLVFPIQMMMMMMIMIMITAAANKTQKEPNIRDIRITELKHNKSILAQIRKCADTVL